jgi:ankyrin repeat protein
MRGHSLATVSLELVEEQASFEAGQVEEFEQSELKDRVWSAIESLPDHERSTMVLYYISGYSQKEVGSFLGVPVTTVKKRLFDARSRLREILVDVVADSLRERRPSHNELFIKRLMEMLTAARAGDMTKVKALLDNDPRLLVARDPLGNTALIIAVNSGHEELAELLLASGIEIDIHEAAAIGKTQRVAELIQLDPPRLDSYSSEGFTPLALAAHFGHEQTTEFLLDQGADVNKLSQHKMGVTPLHAALFGRKCGTARILLKHGADVTIKRGGQGWPRAGWTALHYAAGYGFAELIGPLLERGADVNARDVDGRSPLQIAVEEKQDRLAEILRQQSGTE